MSKEAFLVVWTLSMISGSSCYRNSYCLPQYHCNRLLLNSAQPACYYYCCMGGQWYRGGFPDGTFCKLPGPRRGIGRCTRGVCISSLGAGRPFPPSSNLPSTPQPLPSCNEIPNVVGYAKSCSYTCRSYNAVEQQMYPDETPCLDLAPGGNKPAKPAGLCRGGNCIAHYDIDGDYSEVMAKVFPPALFVCPEKVFLGKMAVPHCHFNCKVGEYWYHGSYTANTTCQGDDPNRLGWCCKGDCHKQMWCGIPENSVDYPIL